MDILNKRNTETAEAALRDLYARLYETQAMVRVQQGALSAFAERMNAIELRLSRLQAHAVGRGPTT